MASCALGICILVRVLHEFLLPWFGVHCNDAAFLDWSWRYACPGFVVSGKTDYAAYAVQIMTTVHMMCPAVRKVWDHWRTASMTGRKGGNVAWDYVLEKMNLSFKTYLSSHVTEARLLKFGVMINAAKHIRTTFELAWRRIDHDFHDEEGGEYSHVEQADVGRLVKALNDHFGLTPAMVDDIELFSTWGENSFASNVYKLPSAKVEDDGMQDLRAHCVKFARLPAQI